MKNAVITNSNNDKLCGQNFAKLQVSLRVNLSSQRTQTQNGNLEFTSNILCISGLFRLVVGREEVTIPNSDLNSFQHTKMSFIAETKQKGKKKGTLSFRFF